MIFHDLTINDKQLIDKMSRNDFHKQLNDSELDFQVMFCWNGCDNSQLAEIEQGLIVLYKDNPVGEGFFAPYITCNNDVIGAIDTIYDFCREYKHNFMITRVNEITAEIVAQSNKYVVERDIKNDEYLYDKDDLIKLVGKRFNGKRNFLNGFIANNKYQFVSYESSMRDRVMCLARQWIGDSEDIEYKCELIAIERALDYLQVLDCFCDCIIVDDKVIAFAIGYINCNNVGVVMFEKADTSFRGAYAAINNFFASKHFANVKLINRQEDMGIEGLRKAKLSYCPISMARKYIIHK